MAEAWQLWERGFTIQTKAATDLLLSETPIRSGMKVLDLGSGSGQPAFAISRAVGDSGRVMATDIAAPPMTALSERARQLGYGNLEARQATLAGSMAAAVRSRRTSWIHDYVNSRQAFARPILFEWARLYDSTRAWAPPRLVATARDGHIVRVGGTCAWVDTALEG